MGNGQFALSGSVTLGAVEPVFSGFEAAVAFPTGFWGRFGALNVKQFFVRVNVLESFLGQSWWSLHMHVI